MQIYPESTELTITLATISTALVQGTVDMLVCVVRHTVQTRLARCSWHSSHTTDCSLVFQLHHATRIAGGPRYERGRRLPPNVAAKETDARDRVPPALLDKPAVAHDADAFGPRLSDVSEAVAVGWLLAATRIGLGRFGRARASTHPTKMMPGSRALQRSRTKRRPIRKPSRRVVRSRASTAVAMLPAASRSYCLSIISSMAWPKAEPIRHIILPLPR